MGDEPSETEQRPNPELDTLDGASPVPEAAPERAAPQQSLRDKVVEVLHDVFDPEIPVNIYELGLVYGVEVDDEGRVRIRMTLTTPNCPEAASMPAFIRSKVSLIPRVQEVEVNLVWDPPWTPERMSEAARLQLGMF